MTLNIILTKFTHNNNTLIIKQKKYITKSWKRIWELCNRLKSEAYQMGMGGGDGQISARLMGKFYLITFICLLRNSFASCSMGEGVAWILVRVINAHFSPFTFSCIFFSEWSQLLSGRGWHKACPVARLCLSVLWYVTCARHIIQLSSFLFKKMRKHGLCGVIN